MDADCYLHLVMDTGGPVLFQGYFAIFQQEPIKATIKPDLTPIKNIGNPKN